MRSSALFLYRDGGRAVERDVAYQNVLAISRMIADAAIEVTAQAEMSVTYSSALATRIAEATYASCDSVTRRRSSKSRDVRTACLCARRARRHTQSIAGEVSRVSEARRDAQFATEQIYAFSLDRELSFAVVSSAVDDAIKAAARAERAARIARGHVWDTVEAALDAAQVRDQLEGSPVPE